MRRMRSTILKVWYPLASMAGFLRNPLKAFGSGPQSLGVDFQMGVDKPELVDVLTYICGWQFSLHYYGNI